MNLETHMDVGNELESVIAEHKKVQKLVDLFVVGMFFVFIIYIFGI